MHFPYAFATLLVSAILVKASPITPSQSSKVVGYYTDWTATVYPPASIPFRKLTHINYAFAMFTESDYAPTIATGNTLTEVVSLAHQAGTKVAISIGGWSGSTYFSPMAATEQGRAAFIQGALALVTTYELDGLDIDWEFPGRQGVACAKIDPLNDATNFLQLLKELRAALGETKSISLAVRVQPIDGPSGPLTSMVAFSKYLDFVNIMAYDINGFWSKTTGPNAPLNASTQGGAPLSVVQSTHDWLAAGFPAEKLVMGLAFYGHSFQTAPNAGTVSLYMPFDATTPHGDSDDAPWADPCPGAVAVLSGVWKWHNLRSQGVLTTPTEAAAPWVRHFDTATYTPWLYNTQTNILISYDDTDSLEKKAAAVRAAGLGGVMLWALNQDNGELLDAALQGLNS